MTDAAQVVELHAGPLRLALRTDLGAALAGLWRHGEPVLQSCEPAALTLSRRSAGFVMAPYSNRLAHRRFRFQGQDYTTAHNSDGQPHSMHGIAFLRPWTVLAQDAASVELAYDHAPDAHWPFAFALRQRLQLSPDGLRLDLRLTNTDPRDQPVGLGWHPYFPKRAGSHLQIVVTDRWERDPTLLPTHRVPQPGIDAAVAALDFDHCFDGWNGRALIRDERHVLTLTAPSSRLVVFTPPQFPFFAVEPVSHVNNAIHMADPAAHGLRTLAPGQAMDFPVTLDVQPA